MITQRCYNNTNKALADIKALIEVFLPVNSKSVNHKRVRRVV